ncbi:MAG: YggT family protein [Microbacteriaceae bacterium]
MGVIATILFVALAVFVVLLWVRLILDWVRALRPRWRPRGAVLVLAEACFTMTDPPIRMVRRVVKPIAIGGARIDFAWSIVLIVTLVLLYLVGPLRD